MPPHAFRGQDHAADRLCLCKHYRGEHHGGPEDEDPSCGMDGCGCALFVAVRQPTSERTTVTDRRRRRAMLWMLAVLIQEHPKRTPGRVRLVDIARALGLSTQRVSELAHGYACLLERRARDATHWREPWAQRLQAEGAIRPPQPKERLT